MKNDLPMKTDSAYNKARSECTRLRGEIDQLQRVIGNIHWMLQGENTEEARENLKAYVGRKHHNIVEELENDRD